MDGEDAIEVGMVGREGVPGFQLALGIAARPSKALVQGPGQALRISARAFLRELATEPELRVTRVARVDIESARCGESGDGDSGEVTEKNGCPNLLNTAPERQ